MSRYAGLIAIVLFLLYAMVLALTGEEKVVNEDWRQEYYNHPEEVLP